MTDITVLFPKQCFEPEELYELGVAFENACAAIAEGQRSEALRETIARRIILWATLGERDATKLYLKTLDQYGGLRAG